MLGEAARRPMGRVTGRRFERRGQYSFHIGIGNLAWDEGHICGALKNIRLFRPKERTLPRISRRPTASISSMNTMQGACFLPRSNRSRTRDATTPTNISTKSEPLIEETGTSRPLLVPRKGRMLRLHRFPEHCRTPPGNPPRPWATALTKAFPVVALSSGVCPSRSVRSAVESRRDGTLSGEENHHDFRSVRFVP